MADPLEDAMRKNKEREQSSENHDVVEVYPPGLLSDLKSLKGEIDIQFAKLMRDPYEHAPEVVDDFKSTMIRLYALMIENDIPIQDPNRKKTLDELITEGLAELGGLLGAKGAMAALKTKKNFRDRFAELRKQEDFEIYQDPETGDYYFIDPETEEEVDCDEFGNPIWEE
tara:strand:+ start:96 stop:605 length:510 start_codon:yes stop_codon:yes gene_type:complete